MDSLESDDRHSASPQDSSDISQRHRLICVSFQSLQKYKIEWKSIIGEDVTIIVDKAHHIVAESYMRILSDYSEGKKVIGLTATPIEENQEKAMSYMVILKQI